MTALGRLTFVAFRSRESSPVIRHFRGAKGDDSLQLANKITACPSFSDGRGELRKWNQRLMHLFPSI